MKRIFNRLILGILLVLGCATASYAQWVVLDPANLVQNITSTAYALRSVNNQIVQLENEARMLENEGKHLTNLQYSNLSRLRTTLATTTRLLQESDGLAYTLTGTESGLAEWYPAIYSVSDSIAQMTHASRRREVLGRAATQAAMRIQAQSAENIASDADTLAQTIDRSQSAVGELQATQATNQLLALQARQMMQDQQLRIAQDRADASEQARLQTMTIQTRELQRRFMGSGTRYTPTEVDFYSR
jgi:type IV secretion system protein TrbJ